MRKYILNKKYLNCKDELLAIILNFGNFNEILGNPERNVIKKIPLQSDFITVKSFKKPHFINKFVYKYFRKSKARRSFEHGQKLLELDILNPEPLAYIENSDFIGITSSYYISKYVDLNRMEFHEKLSFDIKMKSLSNNIKEQPYLDLLMKEYAKVSGYPLNEIKSKINFYQSEFNRKIESKAKFKRFLKKIFK